MTLKKPSLSITAIALSVGTPIFFFIYGQIQKARRPDLDCKGSSDCVDLRGLDKIPLMLGIWAALGVIAIYLAVRAHNEKQAYSKVALGTSIILTIVPVVVLIAIALR